MTDNIIAAIEESEVIQAEIEGMARILRDEFNPLPEHEYKRALLRLGALEKAMEWLEHSIITDLINLPLTKFNLFDNDLCA